MIDGGFQRGSNVLDKGSMKTEGRAHLRLSKNVAKVMRRRIFQLSLSSWEKLPSFLLRTIKWALTVIDWPFLTRIDSLPKKMMDYLGYFHKNCHFFRAIRLNVFTTIAHYA